MKKKTKQRNPVARYLREFNKATVQQDRKKNLKRGYIKHKGKPLSVSVFA